MNFRKSFPGTGLLVLSIMLSANLNGQLKSGYKFGINLTSMSIHAEGVNSLERPTGIHFGGIYDLPLAGKYSLLSGFLFTSKGADYKIDTIDYSLAPSYIELPVNISCSWGRRSTKFLIYAGPYMSFAIGGYKIVGGDPLKDMTFGANIKKDLKLFDFGLNFGAGVKLKGFIISAQYGTGLSDISPAQSSKMRNSVIGISLSSLR